MRVVEDDEWRHPEWPTSQEPRYLKSNTIQWLSTHESMQAPLRFLQCFALQLRRSVAVLQQRPSQGYDPPPSSFGAATSLSVQQKSRRASCSAPLVTTNLT